MGRAGGLSSVGIPMPLSLPLSLLRVRSSSSVSSSLTPILDAAMQRVIPSPPHLPQQYNALLCLPLCRSSSTR